MASDMVERVAEAMWRAESKRAAGRDRLIPWAEENEDVKNAWRDKAGAAIKAMREPTEEMLDAPGTPQVRAARCAHGRTHTTAGITRP